MHTYDRKKVSAYAKPSNNISRHSVAHTYTHNHKHTPTPNPIHQLIIEFFSIITYSTIFQQFNFVNNNCVLALFLHFSSEFYIRCESPDFRCLCVCVCMRVRVVVYFFSIILDISHWMLNRVVCEATASHYHRNYSQAITLVVKFSSNKVIMLLLKLRIKEWPRQRPFNILNCIGQ